MTTLQRFTAEQAVERELAAERLAARCAPRSSGRRYSTTSPRRPLCIYCTARPTVDGDLYCSTICAIDAANDN